MTLINRFILLMILAGIGAAFPYTRAAYAQIAPQTCDSNVWSTMENRARMETEREIMQNQNLIFKADSVLDYVCFDKFAAHASVHVGSLFTHSTYWNNGQPLLVYGRNGNPYWSMDKALEEVVLNSMNTYLGTSSTSGGTSLSTNFGHDLLGGRGRWLNLPKYQNLQTMPNPGQDYSCDVMAKVWMAAKCMNFLHTAPFDTTDGFYPFADLRAGPGSSNNIAGYQTKGDVRDYPVACNGTPITPTWATIYYNSKNATNNAFTADRYFNFLTVNNTVFPAIWYMMAPGGGTVQQGPNSGNTQCSAPIPTGVTVLLSPSSTSGQADGVCANPGCTYISGRCQ